MTTSATPATQPTAELLDAAGVAAMLSVSPKTVRRFQQAGKLPAPIRLSRGIVRWRKRDLEQWLEAGCPSVRSVARRAIG